MGSPVSFIKPCRPTQSPSWVPTRVISPYTVPYGYLYGSPWKKLCPTLPHIRSHVSFITSRRPTRSPLWFCVWRISSHTVPYGFLYGLPSRKFHPILPHMGSRVSFINPLRPIRSPLVVSCVGNFIPYSPVWFPLWAIMQKISPDTDLHQFLHGILLFPMHFHGFPWIPMQSRTETHMEAFKRINLVTEG